MKHYRYITKKDQKEFSVPNIINHLPYNETIILYVDGKRRSISANDYIFNSYSYSDNKITFNYKNFTEGQIVDIYINEDVSYFNVNEDSIEYQLKIFNDVTLPQLSESIARKMYIMNLPKDEIIKKVIEDPEFIKELVYIDDDVKQALLFKNNL